MASATSGAAEFTRTLPMMGASATSTATTSASLAPAARALVTHH
jgi:hypothetical protein